MKKFFGIFIFIFSVMLFSSVNVEAKESKNEVFSVSVGSDTLPIYYNLVERRNVSDEKGNIIAYIDSGEMVLSNGLYKVYLDKVYDRDDNIVGEFVRDVIIINDKLVTSNYIFYIIQGNEILTPNLNKTGTFENGVLSFSETNKFTLVDDEVLDSQGRLIATFYKESIVMDDVNDIYVVEDNLVYDKEKEIVGQIDYTSINFVNGSDYTLDKTQILDNLGEVVGSVSENVLKIGENTYSIGDKDVFERMNFKVQVEGLSSVKNKYKWEHTLCYKINDGEEICEYDVTEDIFSDQTVAYTFYDSDMPFYDSKLNFDYIKFNNSFICVDCSEVNNFVLDEIVFLKDSIDYDYRAHDIVIAFKNNDDKEYVGLVTSAKFIGNNSSPFVSTSTPQYKFIYSVCASDDVCVEIPVTKVSSNDNDDNNEYYITPYIGNLSFNYDIRSKVSYGDNYEKLTFKVKLECNENCDDKRRGKTIELSKEYFLDNDVPFIDEENVIIDNVSNPNNYVKNSEIKITIKDIESGIDEESLKYYVLKSSNGQCGSSIEMASMYKNGEIFTIGEGLTGMYCFVFYASDNVGNTYESEEYKFYFDNRGPQLVNANIYDSSKFYNEFNIVLEFSDLSIVNDVYYLWSDVELNLKEEYLKIKENGEKYTDKVTSSMLKKDGTYYLYVLSYDILGNGTVTSVGTYNLDITELDISEVNVEISGFSEDYTNNAKIKVSVSEMSDNEAFKCGFVDSDNISYNDLNLTCYNNKELSLPSSLEGEYDFYVYVHDRANNYSLFKVLSVLKIDTKSPVISSSVLHDNNEYRIINEITVNITDLNDINDSSLKYGWFLANRKNVLSSELEDTFENGGIINYPIGKYGEYKLYIMAKDNLGNSVFKALDKTFKVDTDVIRISLVGDETVTIIRGEEYKELGARAYKGDILSGGRVSDVVVTGNVDYKKEGTYYVTYSSGEGEVFVSVTRKVIVKNDVGYIVISSSLFAISAISISLRLFIKRKRD